MVVDLSWAELRIGSMCSDGVSATDNAGIVRLRRHICYRLQYRTAV